MCRSVLNFIGVKGQCKYSSSFLKVFKILTHSTLKFSTAFFNCHVNNILMMLLNKGSPRFVSFPFFKLKYS